MYQFCWAWWGFERTRKILAASKRFVKQNVRGYIYTDEPSAESFWPSVLGSRSGVENALSCISSNTLLLWSEIDEAMSFNSIVVTSAFVSNDSRTSDTRTSGGRGRSLEGRGKLPVTIFEFGLGCGRWFSSSVSSWGSASISWNERQRGQEKPGWWSMIMGRIHLKWNMCEQGAIKSAWLTRILSRQIQHSLRPGLLCRGASDFDVEDVFGGLSRLSLIHIWRCRRAI